MTGHLTDTNAGRAGIFAALGAALLFGLGAPLAKLLLIDTSPWLLAGLLYLGSGTGLFILYLLRPRKPLGLRTGDLGWLFGAILSGGVIAPVLLMWGLSHMPAAGASLLLNAEAVLTALLAWFVFRENFDRRVAFGMALIVLGGLLITWSSGTGFGDVWPALAILAACLAWAVDNNLTRKVALADASFIAMLKGAVAGVTNVGLALAAGATLPPATIVLACGALGFFSYGLSLVLFVIALRQLGTARTGAYFSTAPFAGAALSIALLGEELTAALVAGGALMAAGVWLHVTERHEHGHAHDAIEHEHPHRHDEHHRHEHEFPVAAETRHTHAHRHEPLRHSHPHYPDAHHTHRH